MPQYVWADDDHLWTVTTTVALRDEPSSCPECKAPGVRQITLPNIDKTAAGSWNQQSYNPGLGCWTKSWKHGREIAKARGLEEIGNEDPEKVHKHYDNQRKETRERRWAEVDREKVYD
jgi:hypothetical protein